MATGVVIRLKHLPLAAGTIDIRQFFSGLRVPDGGVHIIGGQEGTAFILFSTDEDARRAMMQDGQVIRGIVIKLFLSSHTEMKTVIEHSQRILEMIFMLDEKGRKNGTCLIKFKSPVDKEDALQKDRKYLGSRYVKITTSSERQWLLASTQSCETVRPGESRKRTQSITSSDNTPKRSRALSPLKNDSCVEVRGLPPNTDYNVVSEFLSGLNIVDHGLFLETDGNICKGRAFAEFSSYSDYKEALVRDGDMINGKQVRVIGLSRQNMIDQIRKFKKYISAKREEDHKKEKEKKLEQKRLKEEHDRKKKLERQARKQKEMDEWLRRQHQKEEEQRKKRDLEKKMFQFANTEFPYKEEGSPSVSPTEEVKGKEEYVPEEYNPEDYVPDEYVPEEYVPLPASDGKKGKPPIDDEYTPQENAAGAGEMDIEENSNSPPVNVLSSVPTSISTIPSVLGGSGSMVEAPSSVSFPYNPSVPPPPLPFQSQLSSAFPSTRPMTAGKPTITPMLPPPLAPIHTNLLQASGFPPPFPPTIPILRQANPSLDIKLPGANEKTPSVTHSTPNITLTQTQSIPTITAENNKTESSSSLVRIANSPFNITEQSVRNFFGGLSIPPDGILFVCKEGYRSGHIFIKFSTPEDASKAELLNSKLMLERPVLVRKSTFSQMKDIYARVTSERFIPKFLINFDKEHDALVKKITEEKLTCVCIRNLHTRTGVNDIQKCFADIKVVKNGVVLKDKSGEICKGEAYVELETAEDCMKATELDSTVKVLNNSINIWPLSQQQMLDNIREHERKIGQQFNRSNGTEHAPPTKNFSSGPGKLPVAERRDLPPPPRPPHMDNRRPPPDLPPFDRTRFDRPPIDLPPFDRPFDLPPFDRPPPDLHLFNRGRSSIDAHLPPLPFSPLDRHLPIYPPIDRLLPPDILLRRDFPPIPLSDPFHFPPHLNRPPFLPRGPPLKPDVVTLQMQNLPFEVTREDLLDFFSGFDPLPNSVQLMYDKTGKPTGAGVISFPHIDPARAALAQRHNKPLLQRKIKLTLK
uniref:RRM domain-containing protein n=1 Tax=Ciona savignyi TaxID=51511 RepID=H2Y8D9_CIOSA